MSIVVRMPSDGIPARSHRPETPAPVPISTTPWAAAAAAIIRSAAPARTHRRSRLIAAAAADSTTSVSVTKSSAYAQLAAFCALMVRPYSAGTHPAEDQSAGRIRDGSGSHRMVGWLLGQAQVNSLLPREL